MRYILRTPPLIQAVQGEHMSFIIQLIEGGAEINAIDALDALLNRLVQYRSLSARDVT